MLIKILVVDDNRDTLKRYTKAIQRRIKISSSGYMEQALTQNIIVEAADSVLLALQMLQDDSFDVLVADLRIPGIQEEEMGGLQLISESINLDPLRRIIVITGYGNTDLVKKTMIQGVFDFIEKSTTAIDELIDAVQRAIDQSDLTGHVPFSSDSTQDVLRAKETNDILSLRSLRPEIPTEIDNLILKTMQANPDKRPFKIDDIYPEFERAMPQSVAKKRDPYQLVGTTLFNKYKLDEFTDTGGIGAVYRANQIDHDGKIAIKVLKPDQANSDSIQRFEKEALIARQLKHPHIVEVMDSGSDQDITFLVMEWLNGRNLEKEIEKEGRVPLHRVRTILPQICDALAYAHALNVIHLDVKPSNIFLIGERESADFIKMIDYGLAKVLDTKSSLTVTRFGGTYAYCAPEQFGGKISRRSDIYSLGVSLYHLLTGVLPFGGSYLNAKIHNLDLPPIPSMRRMHSEIPLAVEQVIFKAISKDPKDRYQSVNEFLNAFLEASEDAKICKQGNTDLVIKETLPPKYIIQEDVSLEISTQPGKSSGRRYWEIGGILLLIFILILFAKNEINRYQPAAIPQNNDLESQSSTQENNQSSKHVKVNSNSTIDVFDDLSIFLSRVIYTSGNSSVMEIEFVASSSGKDKVMFTVPLGSSCIYKDFNIKFVSINKDEVNLLIIKNQNKS